MRQAHLLFELLSTLALAFTSYKLGHARGCYKGLKLHVDFLDELQERLRQKRLAELRGEHE